jgi:hypothetical protein
MDMKAGTYKLVDQNAAVLDEADLAALKALLAKLKMGPIEALKEATKEPPVNTSSKRLDEMEKNMLLLTNEVIKLQKLIVDQPKKTSQLNSPVQKEFDYAVYPDIRMSDAVRIERHLSRFAHRAPGSSRGQQQHDSQYADRA